MNITVVGTGYVGLANAILLSQNNEVIALDVNKEKVEKINNKQSPIADKEIEDFLSNKKLNLIATTDKKVAYKNPEYTIIATPTDYDTEKNFFNTSTVESVIKELNSECPQTNIIIKSTIPVGFTERMKKEYPNLNIIFSPEFLREGKALYDNLYPSRIIVEATSKGKMPSFIPSRLFSGKSAISFFILPYSLSLPHNSAGRVSTPVPTWPGSDAKKLWISLPLPSFIAFARGLPLPRSL